MEYYFEFNYEKNSKLSEQRGISFEQIISLIEQGCILDTIDHPNQSQYPNQKIYVIDVDNYCYLVPHVVNDKEIFLKTIIPSRKATRDYKIKTNNKEVLNEKI
jgi:hypothetical protein